MTNTIGSRKFQSIMGDFVCLGGTFDRLHKGHEVLLQEACDKTRKGGRIVVGVTGDIMLKNKYLVELIEPAGVRMNFVAQFLRKIRPDLRVYVTEISDPYGPSITDPAIDTIIVSEETRGGGEKCNELRIKKGYPPMQVVVAGLVGADGSIDPANKIDEKLSSSKLRLTCLGKFLDGGELMCRRFIPEVQPPYTVGVTGGIASGKSSICEFLQQRFPDSLQVIDCDKIGHFVYVKGKPCYDELITFFGPNIVGSDGEIDRKKLGGIVFGNGNKSNLESLNSIVWPHIAEEVTQILKKSTATVCIVEAQVLLEAGWDKLVDETWLVTVSRDQVPCSRQVWECVGEGLC